MMEIVTAIETDTIINSIMIIGTMHITSDAEGLDDFETITSGTETLDHRLLLLSSISFCANLYQTVLGEALARPDSYKRK